MSVITVGATAIGIVVALVLIRSRLWSRARSNRLVRIYTWLFGVEAGIWLVGTTLFLTAPRVIVRALGSASQFQALIVTMLVVCFGILVTVSIRAAR